MNYIQQLNAFYDQLMYNPLTSKSQAIYLAILHLNNKCGWKKEFTIANPMLQALCDISKSELHKQRNILIQAELITYKKGKKGQAGTYQIKRLYDISPLLETNMDTNMETNQETNVDTNTETNVEDIHKLNKTKQKNNNIVPISSAKPSKQSNDIFEHWVDIKAGIKHQKLSADMSKVIDTKIKQHGFEVVKQAISRLATAVHDQSFFYNHEWNLKNFMKQGNGISNWIDEGQMWTKYLKGKEGANEEENGGATRNKESHGTNSSQDSSAYAGINWNQRG